MTVVLGTQWGDEGKGKLVDILAQEIDVCARCAGGNNAGHTIVVPLGPNKEKTMLDFHLLPCGGCCLFKEIIRCQSFSRSGQPELCRSHWIRCRHTCPIILL